MTGPMLVTGALGSVGQRVVTLLSQRGHDVIAADLDTRANRGVGQRLAALPRVRRITLDLTDPAAVSAAVLDSPPRAVLHLAAIIPPLSYCNPALSERVNVGGTRALVDAMAAHAPQARLVFASSLAVYGARNGARQLGDVTAETPTNPIDVYGAQKVRAEQIARTSGLDWSVLRLGGVIAPELVRRVDYEGVFLDGVLPRDNRIHSVSVDDVAIAFGNAVDADCAGQVLLIGGDASHRLRQHEFGAWMRTIAGLGGGGRFAGRNGDPDDDRAWFMTDWMDTDPSWQLLGAAPRSMVETVRDCQAQLSRMRVVLRPFGPAAGLALGLASPYRGKPGSYADPWRAIAARYGTGALADPAPTS
jgi:nucleoside-diphosphate-sugar epimerase